MARILKKRRKLLLTNHLSPGDIVMMTAAVRDLHRRHPDSYYTDVLTSVPGLWENNPYITKLGYRVEPLNGQTVPGSEREVLLSGPQLKIIKDDPEIEVIECHYHGDYPASINRCNANAYHFIHGYAHGLAKKLGVDIPITEFKGDVYVSDLERSWMSQIEEKNIRENFWIVIAGGKRDYTAKWWDPARFQAVVDHFRGKLLFVQCGDPTHWHAKLNGTLDLLGKTDVRQLIRLVYHSEGVLCGVTFAMHLAAAVPMRPFDNRGRKRPPRRACVVVAGGREPVHWEAYPHHQFIHTIGALPCCQHGGCWRSRCQLVGDGDIKDRENLCEIPVQISPELRIPKCMDMITAQTVIERIQLYYNGGALTYLESPRETQIVELATDVKPHDVRAVQERRRRAPGSTSRSKKRRDVVTSTDS